MAFDKRGERERCHAPLTCEREAWIGLYECPCYTDCAGELAPACPNCGRELERRPRPRPQSEVAVA